MSFQEKRNEKGVICKSYSKFGKYKELSFTPYRGYTYAHLSDSKKCHTGSSFDFNKIKSISLNGDEVRELQKLLSEYVKYDALFQQEESTSVTPPVSTPPQEQPVQPVNVTNEVATDPITPPQGGVATMVPFRAADNSYYVITPPVSTPVSTPVTPPQEQPVQPVNVTNEVVMDPITPPQGGVATIAPFRAADNSYYVITPPVSTPVTPPQEQPVQPIEQEIVDLTDDQILFTVSIDGLTQI